MWPSKFTSDVISVQIVSGIHSLNVKAKGCVGDGGSVLALRYKTQK